MNKKKSGDKIVRIMGHGQFTVSSATLKKLNEIDNSIVRMIANSKGKGDNENFRKKLAELTKIVSKKGKRLNPKKIVESDIILPDKDISIEEAKKIFKGEGIIPELFE